MDQVKIGKFICELRKGLGYTQEDLAQKLNVSNKSISRWENGNTMPDLSLIPKLCEVLNITINELLSGEKIKKDEYQKRLEENIIINMDLLKKKVRQAIKRVIISILIIFILMIVGLITFIAYKEITYIKILIPDKNVKIKPCTFKNMVGIKMSTRDDTPFSYDSYYDKKTKTYIVEQAYRHLDKGILKEFSTSTTTLSSEPVDKIIYNDKTIYNKGDVLEPCN